MFNIAKLNSNIAAAICALISSAVFIGLSVGPGQVSSIGALVL